MIYPVLNLRQYVSDENSLIAIQLLRRAQECIANGWSTYLCVALMYDAAEDARDEDIAEEIRAAIEDSIGHSWTGETMPVTSWLSNTASVGLTDEEARQYRVEWINRIIAEIE